MTHLGFMLKFMSGPPGHLLQEDPWLFPSLTSPLCLFTGWLRIMAKQSAQGPTSLQLIWNKRLKSLGALVSLHTQAHAQGSCQDRTGHRYWVSTNYHYLIKYLPSAGRMAESVTCLSWKLEALGLVPQHPCRK